MGQKLGPGARPHPHLLRHVRPLQQRAIVNNRESYLPINKQCQEDGKNWLSHSDFPRSCVYRAFISSFRLMRKVEGPIGLSQHFTRYNLLLHFSLIPDLITDQIWCTASYISPEVADHVLAHRGPPLVVPGQLHGMRLKTWMLPNCSLLRLPSRLCISSPLESHRYQPMVQPHDTRILTDSCTSVMPSWIGKNLFCYLSSSLDNSSNNQYAMYLPSSCAPSLHL